ncbi:MAG: helix-turn-helix transcriptional regulator [Anaerolineales bacterium]|nr:helix-turn-helix transcriptional regulator [Anaerolineales bacterium]
MNAPIAVSDKIFVRYGADPLQWVDNLPKLVDETMVKRIPKRPIVGGTNQGLRPLQYDYWRVGYGTSESLAVDFWIERAGEFHSKSGHYAASHLNHPHTSQFYFHIDGDAEIEANGHVTAVFPGNVLAMPVGVPFHYRSHGVIRYHWFAIPDYWPEMMGSSNRVHWLAWGFDAELESRFAEIREILILGKPGYALRAIGVFYELLARVVERTQPADHAESAYPESVRSAITYLRERYTNPYDAADTAMAVGMSQSHLRALFEKWVGESPQKFHARCRIDEARRLLYQNNLNISQVALLVGFDDPRYFSRVFKQITGMPPSHYLSAQPTTSPAKSHPATH